MAGDHGPVHFLHSIFGVSQFVGKFAIVGEDHQAGAVLVEPTNGINALGDSRDQVNHLRPAAGVGTGRNISARFIDKQVHQLFALNALAINFNAVFQGNLGTQFFDGGVIHGDAALQDQFFARPARAKPGSRKDLLQPLRPRGCAGRFGSEWLLGTCTSGKLGAWCTTRPRSSGVTSRLSTAGAFAVIRGRPVGGGASGAGPV